MSLCINSLPAPSILSVEDRAEPIIISDRDARFCKPAYSDAVAPFLEWLAAGEQSSQRNSYRRRGSVRRGRTPLDSVSWYKV